MDSSDTPAEFIEAMKRGGKEKVPSLRLIPRLSKHVRRRRRGEPGISRVRMRKFYPDFG